MSKYIVTKQIEICLDRLFPVGTILELNKEENYENT